MQLIEPHITLEHNVSGDQACELGTDFHRFHAQIADKEEGLIALSHLKSFRSYCIILLLH